jgi:hypothetical protein
MSFRTEFVSLRESDGVSARPRGSLRHSGGVRAAVSAVTTECAEGGRGWRGALRGGEVYSAAPQGAPSPICFRMRAINARSLITAMNFVRPRHPSHFGGAPSHTRFCSVAQRQGVRPHTSAIPADALGHLDHERAHATELT